MRIALPTASQASSTDSPEKFFKPSPIASPLHQASRTRSRHQAAALPLHSSNESTSDRSEGPPNRQRNDNARSSATRRRSQSLFSRWSHRASQSRRVAASPPSPLSVGRGDAAEHIGWAGGGHDVSMSQDTRHSRIAGSMSTSNRSTSRYARSSLLAVPRHVSSEEELTDRSMIPTDPSGVSADAALQPEKKKKGLLVRLLGSSGTKKSKKKGGQAKLDLAAHLAALEAQGELSKSAASVAPSQDPSRASSSGAYADNAEYDLRDRRSLSSSSHMPTNHMARGSPGKVDPSGAGRSQSSSYISGMTDSENYSQLSFLPPDAPPEEKRKKKAWYKKILGGSKKKAAKQATASASATSQVAHSAPSLQQTLRQNSFLDAGNTGIPGPSASAFLSPSDIPGDSQPKKKTKSGWSLFGGGSSSKKSATKEKPQSQASVVDEGGLDEQGHSAESQDGESRNAHRGVVPVESPIVPKVDFDTIRDEEQKRLTHLRSQTRDEFLEALRDIQKRFLIRQGKHCLWKHQQLRNLLLRDQTRRNNQLMAWDKIESEELEAIMDRQRKELLEKEAAAMLANGKQMMQIAQTGHLRDLKRVDWRVVSAQEQVDTMQVAFCMSQVAKLVHSLFDLEAYRAAVSQLMASTEDQIETWVATGQLENPATVQGKNVANMQGRDFRKLGELRQSKLLIDHLNGLFEVAANSCTESYYKEMVQLADDIDATRKRVASIVNQAFDFLEAQLIPQGYDRVSLPDGRMPNPIQRAIAESDSFAVPQFIAKRLMLQVAPAQASLPDSIGPSDTEDLATKKSIVLRRQWHLTHSPTSEGFALRSSQADLQAMEFRLQGKWGSYNLFDKWLHDSLKWQWQDVKAQNELHKASVDMSRIIESKRSNMLSSIDKRLTQLWAGRANDIKQQNVDRLNRYLQEALVSRPPVFIARSAVENERLRMMEEEQRGSVMRLLRGPVGRDIARGQSGGPCLTAASLKDIHQLDKLITCVQEIRTAVEEDRTLLNDIEVQAMLEDIEKETSKIWKTVSQVAKQRRDRETDTERQRNELESKFQKAAKALQSEKEALAKFEGEDPVATKRQELQEIEAELELVRSETAVRVEQHKFDKKEIAKIEVEIKSSKKKITEDRKKLKAAEKQAELMAKALQKLENERVKLEEEHSQVTAGLPHPAVPSPARSASEVIKDVRKKKKWYHPIIGSGSHIGKHRKSVDPAALSAVAPSSFNDSNLIGGYSGMDLGDERAPVDICMPDNANPIDEDPASVKSGQGQNGSLLDRDFKPAPQYGHNEPHVKDSPTYQAHPAQVQSGSPPLSHPAYSSPGDQPIRSISGRYDHQPHPPAIAGVPLPATGAPVLPSQRSSTPPFESATDPTVPGGTPQLRTPDGGPSTAYTPPTPLAPVSGSSVGPMPSARSVPTANQVSQNRDLSIGDFSNFDTYARPPTPSLPESSAGGGLSEDGGRSATRKMKKRKQNALPFLRKFVGGSKRRSSAAPAPDMVGKSTSGINVAPRSLQEDPLGAKLGATINGAASQLTVGNQMPGMSLRPPGGGVTAKMFPLNEAPPKSLISDYAEEMDAGGERHGKRKKGAWQWLTGRGSGAHRRSGSTPHRNRQGIGSEILSAGGAGDESAPHRGRRSSVFSTNSARLSVWKERLERGHRSSRRHESVVSVPYPRTSSSTPFQTGPAAQSGLVPTGDGRASMDNISGTGSIPGGLGSSMGSNVVDPSLAAQQETYRQYGIERPPSQLSRANFTRVQSNDPVGSARPSVHQSQFDANAPVSASSVSPRFGDSASNFMAITSNGSGTAHTHSTSSQDHKNNAGISGPVPATHADPGQHHHRDGIPSLNGGARTGLGLASEHLLDSHCVGNVEQEQYPPDPTGGKQLYATVSPKKVTISAPVSHAETSSSSSDIAGQSSERPEVLGTGVAPREGSSSHLRQVGKEPQSGVLSSPRRPTSNAAARSGNPEGPSSGFHSRVENPSRDTDVSHSDSSSPSSSLRQQGSHGRPLHFESDAWSHRSPQAARPRDQHKRDSSANSKLRSRMDFTISDEAAGDKSIPGPLPTNSPRHGRSSPLRSNIQKSPFDTYGGQPSLNGESPRIRSPQSAEKSHMSPSEDSPGYCQAAEFLTLSQVEEEDEASAAAQESSRNMGVCDDFGQGTPKTVGRRRRQLSGQDPAGAISPVAIGPAVKDSAYSRRDSKADDGANHPSSYYGDATNPNYAAMVDGGALSSLPSGDVAPSLSPLQQGRDTDKLVNCEASSQAIRGQQKGRGRGIGAAELSIVTRSEPETGIPESDIHGGLLVVPRGAAEQAAPVAVFSKELRHGDATSTASPFFDEHHPGSSGSSSSLRNLLTKARDVQGRSSAQETLNLDDTFSPSATPNTASLVSGSEQDLGLVPAGFIQQNNGTAASELKVEVSTPMPSISRHRHVDSDGDDPLDKGNARTTARLPPRFPSQTHGETSPEFRSSPLQSPGSSVLPRQAMTPASGNTSIASVRGSPATPQLSTPDIKALRPEGCRSSRGSHSSDDYDSHDTPRSEIPNGATSQPGRLVSSVKPFHSTDGQFEEGIARKILLEEIPGLQIISKLGDVLKRWTLTSVLDDEEIVILERTAITTEISESDLVIDRTGSIPHLTVLSSGKLDTIETSSPSFSEPSPGVKVKKRLLPGDILCERDVARWLAAPNALQSEQLLEATRRIVVAEKCKVWSIPLSIVQETLATAGRRVRNKLTSILKGLAPLRYLTGDECGQLARILRPTILSSKMPITVTERGLWIVWQGCMVATDPADARLEQYHQHDVFGAETFEPATPKPQSPKIELTARQGPTVVYAVAVRDVERIAGQTYDTVQQRFPQSQADLPSLMASMDSISVIGGEAARRRRKRKGVASVVHASAKLLGMKGSSSTKTGKESNRGR